jgi:hypothetical protein
VLQGGQQYFLWVSTPSLATPISSFFLIFTALQDHHLPFNAGCNSHRYSYHPSDLSSNAAFSINQSRSLNGLPRVSKSEATTPTRVWARITHNTSR